MNARAEQDRVEGLEYIILGADLDGTDHAWDLIQSRKYNDRKLGESRIGLDALQHLKTVELRHQKIQQNQVLFRLQQLGRRSGAAGRFCTPIALPLQLPAEQVPAVAIVVDDQDAPAP